MVAFLAFVPMGPVQVSSGSEFCKNDTKMLCCWVILLLMINEDKRFGILTHLPEDIDKFAVTMNNLCCCCSLTFHSVHFQHASRC